MMNLDKEALLGKWKEVSALAQKTFNEKITAADLEKVKGNVDMMVSLVESKLGVSREDAQKKVEEKENNGVRIKKESSIAAHVPCSESPPKILKSHG